MNFNDGKMITVPEIIKSMTQFPFLYRNKNCKRQNNK